jgi:pyruvate dehydrogenase E1 component alpha subunit
MGDGAVRQGALHETFNISMTWKVPVIFVIENNNYAMGTSVERTSNVTELYKLGLAYDMPSEPVDGMTVETVHEAMERAVNHARQGKGPYLLELNTYRYKGHSMSDPAKYRSKDEVEAYKQKDPIELVLKTIQSKKYATDAEIEVINAKVRDIVEDSVQFSEESPWPDPSELFTDVYVQQDYPYIKD